MLLLLFLLFSFQLVETDVEDNGKSAPQTFFISVDAIRANAKATHAHALTVPIIHLN